MARCCLFIKCNLHMARVCSFILLVSSHFFAGSTAIIATPSPIPVEDFQPDGHKINLNVNSNLVDVAGHPVIRDEQGLSVYASHVHNEVVEGMRRLFGSWRVGEDPPATWTPTDLKEEWRYDYKNDSKLTATSFLPYPADDEALLLPLNDVLLCEGTSGSPWCLNTKITRWGQRFDVKPEGTLNMIVVLIRFADQESKPLPSRADYDTLFNTDDYVADIAPTGSLKRFFQTVSQGKLTIRSTVEEWITVDKKEEDMSFGNHGLTSRFADVAYLALKRMDERGVDWNQYDRDGDGVLDAVYIIHSGYSAEVGGTDCYNEKEWGPHRIWSHQGEANLISAFESINGAVRMGPYATSSAFLGSCKPIICRIGTICHETGHLLGLPDLVGWNGNGTGVGTWDIMGQLWGFDGSQYLPTMMGAYAKEKLGWVKPQVLTTSGRYRIRASATSGDVYRIDSGFRDGEYLLIENRQALLYDKMIPSTGLLIWHIDENMGGQWQSTPGWPGQEGWPYNGKHYHVSLLQADGLYELEKGLNSGDASDLFSGPSAGLFSGGPYPNSDGYSGGFVFQSDVTISNISESSDEMYFSFTIPARTSPSPTTRPSLRATAVPSMHPSTQSPTFSPQSHHPTPPPSNPLTRQPSQSPTTARPSMHPSLIPTKSPSVTSSPSRFPSKYPSLIPTKSPSASNLPSHSPSKFPTALPTTEPSGIPTESPSVTRAPSDPPSQYLSAVPSDSPSVSISPSSSQFPTSRPSLPPSVSAPPSHLPSPYPTLSLSEAPSFTTSPSDAPSHPPTVQPTPEPSQLHTTVSPSVRPSLRVYIAPTSQSSSSPSSPTSVSTVTAPYSLPPVTPPTRRPYRFIATPRNRSPSPPLPGSLLSLPALGQLAPTMMPSTLRIESTLAGGGSVLTSTAEGVVTLSIGLSQVLTDRTKLDQSLSSSSVEQNAG